LIRCLRAPPCARLQALRGLGRVWTTLDTERRSCRHTAPGSIRNHAEVVRWWRWKVEVTSAKTGGGPAAAARSPAAKMPSASRRTGDETIMGEEAAARTLAEGERRGRGFATPGRKAATVGTAASAIAARAAERTMASGSL
jgi:hypothetical protein